MVQRDRETIIAKEFVKLSNVLRTGKNLKKFVKLARIMKLYTSPEQTAKLIELGFEQPTSIGGYKPTFRVEYDGEEVSKVIIGENKEDPIIAYSIGELIEMLPNDHYPDRRLEYDGIRWVVDWDVEGKIMQTMSVELIDALYDMITRLKEEGVR